jgi:excisionase family DNA binding protein
MTSSSIQSGVIQFQSYLLTCREAALYLGISEQTLAIWKCTGRCSLPCVKIGRLVKYRKSDLDAFIAGNTSAI